MINGEWAAVRVVVCPDKFAGTLTAVEAAGAIADGWCAVAPGDELVVRPVADGGPGFVEVLHASLGGELVDVPTTDPLGRPVTGRVLIVGDTAYVESAHACGLHHLAAHERDPKITTTAGLGALVNAAAGAGARRAVIGLGGSGTNDAGAGMLSSLGLIAYDASNVVLLPGGAALRACVDIAGAVRLPAGFELVGASDVDNPLTGPDGASAVFGPQKGAAPADVAVLDAALSHWAALLEQGLPGCPKGLAEMPGGGAAGGLGAAILALGGRIISGIDLVRDQTGLDAALSGADLVITGEGSFDHQSLRGKVIAGVAGAARDLGIPCVVLAGRVTTGRREQGTAGVTEAYSLVDHLGSIDLAMAEPARGLRELASRLARQYSRDAK
ncbi:glycerate kinase [Allorhizocola rhizosphaerae]|uniref:glycerate kinase family protein n=1 Tax=Allorhizocola rhizosphaerae TaxID=1872709 RepID=UPI001478C1FE|nr:glycerate kinase [Allorhizocola rhizosphaerae]